MTKKQIALRVALPILTIVILVALMWQPAVIWFRLYRLRGDEASAREAMGHIIELGPTMQPPLIDAIHAHAPEPGVGFFRPAAFGVLARLRQERVLEHRDHAILLVPLNEETIDAMVVAYENEPSAAYRQEMREALWDVDESTHFVFWGRTATGPYPLELIPDSHFVLCPGPPSACGDLDLPELLSPAVAVQWCEHVGSIVRVWIADDSAPYPIDAVKLSRILDRRCVSEDSPFADLSALAPNLDTAELLEVLNHAYSRKESQAEVLSALIQPAAECDWQRRLHRGLEIRRPHVGDTPELLRAWVTNMDDACLAELFDDTAPDARRDRMRRSLGVLEAHSAD